MIPVQYLGAAAITARGPTGLPPSTPPPLHYELKDYEEYVVNKESERERESESRFTYWPLREILFTISRL